MGIKRVADGTAAVPGMEADTEAALRRTRRLFINRDNLRAATRTVVNATLDARDTSLWGPGTACASDSRKFGSWSANFMTGSWDYPAGSSRQRLLSRISMRAVRPAEHIAAGREVRYRG